MLKLLSFIGTYIDRRKRLSYTIPEFSHHNKELLILVCDPKTDEIYVCYNDKIVRGRVGSTDGKHKHIIRDVLKYGRFKTKITAFLLELQVALGAYRPKAHYLWAGIHDALFSVAKANTKGVESLQENKELAKVGN